MSHLLKTKKNSIKFLRIFFYAFISISVFTIIYFYKGNKINMVIFAILFNCIFYFVFSRKAYFFEMFFGGLLWLGFYYKLFLGVIFDNYIFREGAGLYGKIDFNAKIEILNNTLIIASYGVTGFLLACLIKKHFLYKFFNLRKNLTRTDHVLNIKLLLFFLLIFFISFFTITISNFYLGIYQRGIISTFNVHFTVSAIYKWLLLFGFSSFIAFCFIFTLKSKPQIYAISTISIIETFFSNLAFLSRGMIFNCFAIFIGLYKSNRFYKLKLNIKFFLIYLFCILSVFYLSVISVNYLRANIFFVKKDPLKSIIIESEVEVIDEKIKKKYDKFDTSLKEFFELSRTRWVGIDALLAVEASDEKNYNFFKNSFFDKFDKDKYPYYERNIQKRVKKLNNTIQYGITTPGIFAFLYYTGSQIFVFFIIFSITLFILTIEKFIFSIFNNLILCSILSQVFAYRLIHFGYMPQNTYFLLTSILITIIGLFLLKKLLVINKK